jgi:hypothetical protein
MGKENIHDASERGKGDTKMVATVERLIQVGLN